MADSIAAEAVWPRPQMDASFITWLNSASKTEAVEPSARTADDADNRFNNSS
jgi:hypothetical protein